jgi:putative chromate ion transporter
MFFLKAGSLTFGSGLVIVPFLQRGLVQEYGWLNEREFLVAVAVGMISPGPVVITATFVGFLVAGFWGSLVATMGIFLPSFLYVLVVAPVLSRHRANKNVQGFVKGAYAAGPTIAVRPSVPTIAELLVDWHISAARWRWRLERGGAWRARWPRNDVVGRLSLILL